MISVLKKYINIIFLTCLLVFSAIFPLAAFSGEPIPVQQIEIINFIDDFEDSKSENELQVKDSIKYSSGAEGDPLPSETRKNRGFIIYSSDEPGMDKKIKDNKKTGIIIFFDDSSEPTAKVIKFSKGKGIDKPVVSNKGIKYNSSPEPEKQKETVGKNVIHYTGKKSTDSRSQIIKSKSFYNLGTSEAIKNTQAREEQPEFLKEFTRDQENVSKKIKKYAIKLPKTKPGKSSFTLQKKEVLQPVEDMSIKKDLSTGERLKLNRDMAQAVMLFFDNHYKLAYEQFKTIGAIAQSKMINYWLGKTAFYCGFPQVTIDRYQSLLSEEPGFSKARLILSRAYLQLGKEDLAKQNYYQAFDELPDWEKAEQKNMIFDKKIRRLEQKLFYNVKLNTSAVYDSNVNAQPEERQHGVLVSPEIKSDMALQNTIFSDFKYDFGKRRGFYSKAYFSYIDLRYLEESEYNFTQIDTASSLDWLSRALKISMPFGWRNKYYDSKFLADSLFTAPEATFFYNKNFSVTSKFTYENEDYSPQAYQAQDNRNWVLELGAELRKRNRRTQHFGKLISGYKNKSAEDKQFSYSQFHFAGSYNYQIYGIDFSFLATYKDRCYGANIPKVWGISFPDKRKDQLLMFSSNLNKTFNRYLSSSIFFSYYNNDSNTSVYDYQKYQIGLRFKLRADL
jgi:hypothetical protein